MAALKLFCSVLCCALLCCAALAFAGRDVGCSVALARKEMMSAARAQRALAI